MAKKRLLFTLFCLFWLIGGGVAWSAAPQQPDSPTVATTANGVSISWQLPVDAVQQPGAPLALPDYELAADPGGLQLPQQSFLIAVPPGAATAVTFDTLRTHIEPLTAAVPVAPTPQGVVRDATGAPVGGAFVPVDAATTAVPPLARLENVGTVRGVQLMRLVLTPLRPDGDRLRVATSGQVRVTFSGAHSAAVPLTPAAPADPLLQAVQAQVVNPQHTAVAPAAPPSRQQISANASPATAIITVVESGITVVTHADLSAAGFPVGSVNPANLRLAHAGAEIPIEWAGDGDAAFEAGERFYFYAAPRFSRWHVGDSYLLTAQSGPRQRIAGAASPTNGLPAGAARVTEVFEENAIYTPDCLCGSQPLGRDGDRWMWDDLRQPGRPSNSYSLPLPTVDSSASATLTLWMMGFTSVFANPDHQVDVVLNGNNLGSVSWDGKTAVSQTLTIDPGELQSDNTLTLTLPGLPGVSVDGVWLDAVAIEYTRGSGNVGRAVTLSGEATQHAYTIHLATGSSARVYDVTDPAAPVKLTGLTTGSSTVAWGDRSSGTKTYAVAVQGGVQTPAQIRMKQALQTAATTGADYLVITPADFAPALTPLRTLRQSQGLSVAVEHVQAIYDTYGDGRVDPQAIRDFLADAYSGWTPRPTYVLLVGDGSSDPKQYRDSSGPTWIPPYLADVDPWIGEVPADNRYVTVDGGDILPDMLLGRLPVNSLAETQTVVAKLVQYETAVLYNGWNGNVTFVADDADSAGNFAAHSDRLIDEFIAAPQTAHRVYHDGNVDQTVTAVQQRWQQGNGLMIYTGHSSVRQWAAERLFHLDDVAGLSNSERLPVVLQMTCFTGSYHLPGSETLDEGLLRHANGGAVAVWGATGLGVSTGHEELSQGFLHALYVDGEVALGTAVLAGKVQLMTDKPAHQDLVDTFTFLGDPATQYRLAISSDSRLFLPLVTRK